MPKAPQDPSPQSAELAFFARFAWAIPDAFAAAVAEYRFEQGDVLYPERGAYAAQTSETLPERALQILLPKRSARAAAPSGETDRKLAQWRSEVVLEDLAPHDGERTTRKVSQGQLLMFLWRGDEQWLEGSAVPPMPRAGRDLAAELEGVAEALSGAFATRRGSRFLFVVDRASDASRAKAQRVEEALASLGKLEKKSWAPAEAGLEEADTFHPTLDFMGIAIAGASVEAMQEALRSALYVGGAGGSRAAPGEGEQDEETAPDRFSVARHGSLAALGGD